jgi:hypothetical protein
MSVHYSSRGTHVRAAVVVVVVVVVVVIEVILERECLNARSVK